MIWLLGGYMWLFIHRPFEVWPALGTLQIERGYMILLLLVWLLSPGKGLAVNRINLSLVLFALAMLLTWLASPYAGMAGPLEAVENYFKVAVFYVLLITTVRSERDLRLMLLIYLGSVGLYMTHSLLEYINGRYEFRQDIRRMVGVDISFRDPNAFASGLLFALPMTFPFWMERPRRIPRSILLGFTAIACLCILLTGSRTGFLGILLVGVISLLLFIRRKGLALVLVALSCVGFLALLTVALPDELQTRYLTIVDSSYGPRNAQESAEGRVEGFWTGVELWQRSPLLGQGPGAYMAASGSSIQPHNLYGQVLAEMGLAGVLALGALCTCFLLNWLETRQLYARLRALNPFAHEPGEETWSSGPETPPTSLAYLVSRSAAISVVLLLLLGFAGHNLYRFHWQWFAAFQAIAVSCLRTRVGMATSAAAASPYLILSRIRPRLGRPEVPPAPQW
jgi:O-antigen ligase